MVSKGLAEDDTVDLLQMSLADEGNVVTEVDGANLQNAALVKAEITDFMKYRAPINIMTGIVDKFTNVKSDIKDAESDTELVDKKNDFYEKEGEVVDKAHDIYIKREKYKTTITKTTIDDMKAALPEYKTKYQEMHEEMFKNLYNSKNTNTFVLDDIYDYSHYTPTTYSDSKKSTERDIKNAVNDLSDAYDDFITATNNMDKVSWLTYTSGTTYQLQYWVQTMKLIGNSSDKNVFSKFAKASNTMIECYQELKNALDYTEVEDLSAIKYSMANKDENYTLQNYVDDVKKNVESGYNSYAKNYDYTYYTVGKQLASASSTNAEKIKSGGVDTKVANIYAEINGFYTAVTDAKELAEDIASDSDDLITLVGEYEVALDNWRNTAEASTTDLGSKDKEELKKVGQILEEVSVENIEEFKTRYTNISSKLGEIETDINAYAYGPDGKAIKKIGGYGNLKEYSGIDEKNIVLDSNTLATNATNSFVFSEPETLAINNIDSTNDPDVTQGVTDFDDWMTSKFQKEVDEDALEGKKSKLEDIKKQGEDKANESYGDGETEGKDISEKVGTSGATDDGSDKDTKAIKKANSSIKDLVQEFSLEENVERYYTLDYVMSMFTYDTYKREGLYNMVTDPDCTDKLGWSGNAPDTIAGADSLLSTCGSKWDGKEEVDFTKNKSLTNKMMNTTNNYGYGSEVEYILYGNTNSKNKTSAYGRIYLIRYAMDTPVMFNAWWNKPLVTKPAQAISISTGGVIPEFLVRIAIIMAMTAVEAAEDVAHLKAGLPVKFVKSDDDLYLSNGSVNEDTGLVDTSKTEDNKNSVVEDINGFFYSDYLKLFLFAKLISDEDGTYQRISDVVQCNMQTRNGDFSMANAQVYYQLNATIEMPPLMMKLPINQSEDSWADLVNDKYSFKCKATRGY